MGRQIYEKTTRELLKDMLREWDIQPGQVFTRERVVQWFAANFPKLAKGSIRAHLVQASTNDPSRLHHPSTKTSDDLLYRVLPGQYRLYIVGQDPAPYREHVEGDTAQQLEQSAEADVDEEEDFELDALPGSSEFLLEKDLQRYLAENLWIIETGLQLYVDPEGVRGIEYDADGRRIDILAIDREKNLCVIELKVSKGYDRVIGQTLRYKNWVQREIADPGQKVRGIIVCRKMTDDIRLAAAGIPGIELYEYELKVAVAKVAAMDLPG
ncbi:endonuclease NucS domain-containing protein [Stutzerimonas stutzeri]|uniref:endonuclease NucS domain-containing protein n=1 Tax=Stutzerimonas stutzeri TaxID=316 RepID=UPI00210B45A7|nr:endonuclease NucS domain-containing protein [Stutzerimonas stutzeri]MCQ4322807.1 endonuclease NucS [Stutzerimonas stutzeri]